MGDPHAYITPDVVADFTTIQLEPDGENRVRVFGIKGRPPTDKLKVSIAYRAGFKAVGTLVYAWPDALEKAQLADRVLRERLDNLGLKFDQILTEFVGVSATHGPLAGERATIRRRCSCASACAATGQGGGRAIHARDRAARAERPAERHRLRRRPPEGRGDRRLLAGAHRQDASCRRRSRCSHESPPPRHRARPLGRQGRHGQRRRHRARARVVSGARASTLTRRARRASTFEGVITGDVERYELPNLNALNFLLHGALDGGGTLSLKTDAQGKVFSTAMLRMVLDVPDAEAKAAGLPGGSCRPCITRSPKRVELRSIDADPDLHSLASSGARRLGATASASTTDGFALDLASRSSCVASVLRLLRSERHCGA